MKFIKKVMILLVLSVSLFFVISINHTKAESVTSERYYNSLDFELSNIENTLYNNIDGTLPLYNGIGYYNFWGVGNGRVYLTYNNEETDFLNYMLNMYDSQDVTSASINIGDLGGTMNRFTRVVLFDTLTNSSVVSTTSGSVHIDIYKITSLAIKIEITNENEDFYYTLVTTWSIENLSRYRLYLEDNFVIQDIADNNDTSLYDSGYASGYASGTTDGYADGLSDGESIGYINGYLAGESDGYLIGYDDGYDVGIIDADDGGFGNFIYLIFVMIKLIIETQILPGVTIGMIALIPISFGIIKFVLERFGK
jgi:hypothetical protein